MCSDLLQRLFLQRNIKKKHVRGGGRGEGGGGEIRSEKRNRYKDSQIHRVKGERIWEERI